MTVSYFEENLLQISWPTLKLRNTNNQNQDFCLLPWDLTGDPTYLGILQGTLPSLGSYRGPYLAWDLTGDPTYLGILQGTLPSLGS